MLLNISCAQASQLVSQKLDQPLSLKDKLLLRIHLLICVACPTLHRKLEIIHLAGQRYPLRDDTGSNANPGLSRAARDRIVKNLRQARENESDR